MAEYTPNLSLLKKDPAVDGNDTFNIKTMLNDNWDKIDVFSQTIEEGLGNVDDVELAVSNLIEQVGNLEEVNTETKLNLVAAINEVYRKFNEHEAEKVQHLSYAIATGTNSYAVSIPEITSLVEGMSIKINFTSANTGACTLNINGLGAIPIKKSNGNDLSSGNIKAGQIVHLVYTGTVFQLLGEGGEYGNAQANHVLSPYTFGTEEGIKTGAMINRGAVSKIITTQNGTYIVPAGYHNGSGIVKATFANLTASNIKSGVTIGGVIGNYIPTVSGTPKHLVTKTVFCPYHETTLLYTIPTSIRNKVAYKIKVEAADGRSGYRIRYYIGGREELYYSTYTVATWFSYDSSTGRVTVTSSAYDGEDVTVTIHYWD